MKIKYILFSLMWITIFAPNEFCTLDMKAKEQQLEIETISRKDAKILLAIQKARLQSGNKQLSDIRDKFILKENKESLLYNLLKDISHLNLQKNNYKNL